MDHERHLVAIAREAAALATAARRDPTARVPSCPDWDVSGLVAHTGVTFRWAAEIVRTHADAELVEGDAPETDDVVTWFDECTAELIEVLTNESPDSPAWNWSEQDLTAAFWTRRMSNEVAVHRWDAQLATSTPDPLDPTHATDVIDELLTVFLPSGLLRRPADDVDGLATLTTTDTGAEWRVRLWPDRSETTRAGGGDPAERLKGGTPPSEAGSPPPASNATLSGTASDLALAMWGRDVRVDTAGDERIVRLLLE